MSKESNKKYYREHKEEIKIKNRERYLKNKEKYLAQQRERYKNNRDEILRKQREWQRSHIQQRKDYYEKQYKGKFAARSKAQRDKLRKEVLDHYGNKCACCGEIEPRFLTMDHINGGGNKHRKSLGGPGTEIYKWIKKNNYPSDFQILCYNCNCAKGHYGICPHQMNREEEVL